MLSVRLKKVPLRTLLPRGPFLEEEDPSSVSFSSAPVKLILFSYLYNYNQFQTSVNAAAPTCNINWKELFWPEMGMD